MSKGAQTRERVIAKAAVLFNRKGFVGCSMQDIVEDVGLEKGSIYGHFSTKEELAVAAFEHAWTKTSVARLSGVAEEPHALAKLKRHVDNVVSIPSFPGGCPLVNTLVDNDDGNPALKKAARDALKNWRLYLHGIVEQGRECNEIREDVDPDELAVLLISQLEGAMALDRVDKKAGFLEKMGRFLFAHLDTLSP